MIKILHPSLPAPFVGRGLMQHLNAFGLYPMLSPSKHQCLGVIALSTSLAFALPTHAAVLDQATLLELDLSDAGYSPPILVLRLRHSINSFSTTIPSDRPDFLQGDPFPVPLHPQEVPIDQ